MESTSFFFFLTCGVYICMCRYFLIINFKSLGNQLTFEYKMGFFGFNPFFFSWWVIVRPIKEKLTLEIRGCNAATILPTVYYNDRTQFPRSITPEREQTIHSPISLICSPLTVIWFGSAKPFSFLGRILAWRRETFRHMQKHHRYCSYLYKD